MEDSNRSIFKSPLFYSIIVALIISTLGYYFTTYRPNKKKEVASAPAPVSVKTSTEIDSDKDGLPDWKEAVYGSDPKNKDTDGDGIQDGAEINMGHDPTKKGPDDILHNIILKDSASSSENDVEKTFVTEFMSQEIDKLGEQTVSGLIKSFDVNQIKPRYSISDLNIIYENSPEKLKEYANSFGVIVNKYVASNIEGEEKILSTALKTKKESDLQKIEIPALAYRNLSDELKKLPTPNSLSEYHLNVVSGYDVMSRSLYTTEKLFSNPMAGSAGWQMYLTQLVTVTNGYAGIINVLHDKNVTFDSTEPGYQFHWRGEEAPKDTKNQ